ncbi:MAG: site-specific integrase [Dysgonamonadaceae bacterium]|jgi:integrase|nr:site-specific integrase [Dysgonamonadaceae bacterium]
MVNIRLVIFPKKVKATGECRVYVQLTHRRKATWIKTAINVRPEHFENGRVNPKKDPNAALKNVALSEAFFRYEKKILILGDRQEYMSLNAIRDFLQSKSEALCETDFFRFSENRIKELKEIGRTGTSNPLQNAIRRFRDFLGKDRIEFNDISVNLLEKFIFYYQKKGHRKNSIANYLTYIRSMFNDAIDEYNINPAQPVIFNYPFKKIKIERGVTLNRNLPIETIRKIRDFNPQTYTMEIAIDMFMLQLYLFGINIKDLFYMKHENIVDGRLQFNRHKTGRFYNIKLEAEAIAIIEKYRGEKHLMWFADHCALYREAGYKPHTRQSERQWIDSGAWLKMINDQLQKIEAALGLKLACPLTSYFSRHSFATIMREIGISRDDISLCLGHRDPEQSMKISGIYINEDYRKADIANRKLIDHINETAYILLDLKS